MWIVRKGAGKADLGGLCCLDGRRWDGCFSGRGI